MSRANLKLIQSPTRADEAKALIIQARNVGRQCVDDMLAAITEAEARALEVADIESIPAGVRDMARVLAGDLRDRMNGMAAIMERVRK